jgi:hypothetical protein
MATFVDNEAALEGPDIVADEVIVETEEDRDFILMDQ